MKNSIKTYFKDYVEAQKVCNEFNKNTGREVYFSHQ